MKLHRIKTLLTLFRRAYRGYKKQIIWLIILGFFSGILEGVGVNAIIPLFSFITDGAGQATDFISRIIRKLFEISGIPFNLQYLLIFIILLFIIKAISLVVFNYINIKITSDYEKNTRSKLFKNTLKAKWSYLLNQKTGYLEQVLITDVARSSSLLRHISGMILMATNLIIYLVVAINISPLITLITLIIGTILFVFFKPLFYKARMASREQASLNKQTSHLVNENMIGAKTVKTAAKEGQVVEKADAQFDKLQETSIRVNLISSFNNSLVEPVGVIFIVALFALSYKLPSFNFASFAVIIYLIQRIFSYLQIAQNRLQTISELAPYLGETIHYAKAAEDNQEDKDQGKKFSFEKNIRVQNLCFQYPDTDVHALHNISLDIKKGEMVGIIGPSGAGKTTLVDIFLRLFKIDRGKILLDDTNIQEISMREWRNNIGYVSQDIFLLNDTIANNIRFYDDSISLSEIKKAAKLANIDAFINQLPKKYDTPVGERGLLLSGGQRQRIVLARVLINNPKLLILDEATSALDSESEQAIHKTLLDLKGKITTLIIAHRLSTIKNCDKLLVLDNGELKEQGPPQDLLADKKSYFYKVSKIN